MSEIESQSISQPLLQDGILSENQLNVSLANFEGPLDLLLFLIRKNEINIYDIPIVKITEQYLQILRTNQKEALDIAGDFFVMAATLMYIKSRMLLPTSELPKTEEIDSEGVEEDPRWQLVEQLIQYKKLKDSAGYISNLISERQNFLQRFIVEKENQERTFAAPGKMELWNVFNLILNRLSERIVPGEIQGEVISIAQSMGTILERIKIEKSFSFTSLLPEKVTVAILVSMFLACLELTRLGQIKIKQDALFEEIYCTACENAETINANKEPEL